MARTGKKTTPVNRPSAPRRPTGVDGLRPERPRVLAAIDVGTSSVRMEVAEALPDGSLRTLDQLVHPIRLGSDTFRVGRVTPETMRALAQVIANFSRIARECGAEQQRAVATSGIRDASNQDMLVDRIRHASGITLQVMDAVEECRLTYQVLLPFLRRHFTRRKRHTMLFDLGGGSTEIMVLHGENLVFAGTRRLGTTRLFHGIASPDGGQGQALLESAIRNIVNSALDVYRNFPVSECVIINPLLLSVFRNEPECRQLGAGGLRVTTQAARAVIREATQLSPEALARRFGLSCSDAELVLPAFLVLGLIIDNLKLKRIHFAQVDLLTGILHDLVAGLKGEDPHAQFSSQIIGSATGIAERFRYDARHAQHVAALANQLFDGLSSCLDLAVRDRLYLHVAAILHDIGMFVSERSHHKHSMYLVQWSEIIGLSEEEQHFVAVLVRYHRKAKPQPQHAEFMSLPAPERLHVCKLAAILRIADGLDRGHMQAVRRIRAELADDELMLHAQCTGDLSVETAALRDKADLFEEITGLEVSLRRELA